MTKACFNGVSSMTILALVLPVALSFNNCTISSSYMCGSSALFECNICLPKRMPGQLDEPIGKRATFGMGCFWAGDSLFGVTPGVIRTAVGYAGGTKDSPTYRNMGDHTEVIHIEYDPEIVSYTQLLSLFWNNHEYGLTTKIKRQYMSLVLYHDEEQRVIAEKSREHEQHERSETITTEIRKFEKFYPAEE